MKENEQKPDRRRKKTKDGIMNIWKLEEKKRKEKEVTTLGNFSNKDINSGKIENG